MNKSELIDAMAKESGLSKKDATAALAALTDTIAKELKKAGKVQLIGFGTFEVVKRNARTGVNPQTGKKIKIAATKVPRFKAGAGLKEIVNGAKKKKKINVCKYLRELSLILKEIPL